MNGALHIYAPASYYIGQLRGCGCRRWRTVTGKCGSSNAALARAIGKATRNDKRARTLLCARDGWLEPIVVGEGRLQ